MLKNHLKKFLIISYLNLNRKQRSHLAQNVESCKRFTFRSELCPMSIGWGFEYHRVPGFFYLLCLQYHTLVPSLTEGANLRVCIIDGAARIFLPPPMPRLGIELSPVQLHLFIRNLIQEALPTEIPQLRLGEQTKKTELKISQRRFLYSVFSVTKPLV